MTHVQDPHVPHNPSLSLSPSTLHTHFICIAKEISSHPHHTHNGKYIAVAPVLTHPGSVRSLCVARMWVLVLAYFAQDKTETWNVSFIPGLAAAPDQSQPDPETLYILDNACQTCQQHAI